MGTGGRYEDGWIKLHRKILNSDIGRDLELLGLWVTLIKWACWEDSKQSIKFGNERVILKRGQLWTTVRELAKELGTDKNKIARLLGYLSDTARIETRVGTKGSIITILNYAKYQDDERPSETLRETRPGHDRDSSKEEKKERRRSKTGESGSPALLSVWIGNPLNDPSTLPMLERIDSPSLVQAWRQLYHDDHWLKRELAKAHVWILANPSRAPRSQFGSFMARWLKKGWEDYRKTIGNQAEINTTPINLD